MESVQHGLSGYTSGGCRCEICRAAWAAYHRDYRRRRADNGGDLLRGPRTSSTPATTEHELRDPSLAMPRLWIDQLVRAGVYLLTGALVLSLLRVNWLLSGVAVIAGASVLERLAVRCHLCGTRGSHRCNLVPDVYEYSRFVRGVLRDRDRRAGQPWKGTTAQATRREPDIVWECPHKHESRRRRNPRREASACAKAELRRLQRGRASWSYPFRSRPEGPFRYEPGVRLGLPRAEWERLLREANGRCFYCGQETDELEADHVIPVSRGGSSMTWNFVVACKECNRLKGARTGLEFVPHPTPEQRQRFLEIDRLSQRRTIAWRERRRLERGVRQRRREGARKRREMAGEKREARRDAEFERWKRSQYWYREE